MRHNQGFTLIEILLAIGIFGVVMVIASEVFSNANTYTTLTVSSADLEEDVRLGVLRMTEVTSQASYIYPNGVTISWTGGTVTTGKLALALLAPSGTPYCPLDLAANKSRYCLFIYRTQPRSGYSSTLPARKNVTADVIVEQRLRWVEWRDKTSPLTVYPNVPPLSLTQGVLVDSVDTTLSDLSQLEVGSQRGSDPLNIGVGVANTDPTALIQVARPLISVRVNSTRAQRSGYIFVRSIPRATPPGVGTP